MSWRYWYIDRHILVEGQCPTEHAHWSLAAPLVHSRIIFVRSGVYLRRVNGVESWADSTTMLVARAGDELEVAHPLGCGDMFTYVDLVETDVRPGVYGLGDELDLHHRRLVAAARRGTDRLELGERVAQLVDRLPPQPCPQDRWSPQTQRAHRKLAVGAAEALIGSGYEAGLDGIAAQLSCSPHHLSRVFRRVTGLTLTEYRNRVRVGEVLADIQDGARNMRELAARYGFADQAHMIRVVRRHYGAAPGILREVLAAPIAHGNTTRH